MTWMKTGNCTQINDTPKDPYQNISVQLPWMTSFDARKIMKMKYFENHCTATKSTWDAETFDSSCEVLKDSIKIWWRRKACCCQNKCVNLYVKQQGMREFPERFFCKPACHQYWPTKGETFSKKIQWHKLFQKFLGTDEPTVCHENSQWEFLVLLVAISLFWNHR